ncbi:hypothetical protein GCM10017690_32200 [Microbacterium terregens]
MVANLVRAGHDVHGFDLSSVARDRVQQTGATVHPDLADMAGRVDVLILILPDSGVVERVVEDCLASGVLRPGVLMIDMSSSEPARTRALALGLAPAGVRVVDAPVSGGVGGAERGDLTIMAGGDPRDVEDARVFLEPLGSVSAVGALGAGHAMKALNNLLSATHLWITGEVMAAGAHFGLDPHVMVDAFNSSSGRSGSTEKKWPSFVLPATFDSGFALGLMVKDMRIALDLCETVGGFRTLSEASVAMWEQAAESLPAESDHTQIATWIVERGGRVDVYSEGSYDRTPKRA